MHNQNRHHGNRNNHHKQQGEEITKNHVQFMDNGKIDKTLYNEKAEKVATILASTRSRDANSYTQIRRFYDEITDFYDEIEISEDKESAFKTREPLILMLNSKVSYAKGRKKVDDNFVKFVKFSLNQVNDYSSFKTFKLLFEAVMGFLRAKKA